MGKHHFELPTEVREVRGEIEQWRQNRQKRSPMPARLWSAAAELAQAHGIYRISQALRLSYESLKSRVIGSSHTEGKPRQQIPSRFVEVGGMSLVRAVEHSSVEVEMFGRGGERMIIRAKGCTEVDFASMVDGFWSRNK